MIAYCISGKEKGGIDGGFRVGRTDFHRAIYDKNNFEHYCHATISWHFFSFYFSFTILISAIAFFGG